MNVIKLRVAMLERGVGVTALSNKTGISRDTLYRRMKASGCFTIEEASKIKEALELGEAEANAIFFGE